MHTMSYEESYTHQERRLRRDQRADAPERRADGVHGVARVGGEQLRRVHVHDVVRERRQHLEHHEQRQPQPRVACNMRPELHHGRPRSVKSTV